MRRQRSTGINMERSQEDPRQGDGLEPRWCRIKRSLDRWVWDQVRWWDQIESGWDQDGVGS